MTSNELEHLYSAYIECLNQRNWTQLGRFVSADVVHNGRPLGLQGYQEMLEQNIKDIPDLQFEVDMLTVQPPRVASRLRFDCTPKGTFLGVPINGRRVIFFEHAFYNFRDHKIERVWSIIDKEALEKQM